MTEDTVRHPATLFKALMHPARLAILDLLRQEEACVCHLEAALGYRQAYLSQQLAVLRAAGIVEDRREGLNVFYRVTVQELYALLDGARRITGAPGPVDWPAPPLTGCPCPRCAAPDGLARAAFSCERTIERRRR